MTSSQPPWRFPYLTPGYFPSYGEADRELVFAPELPLTNNAKAFYLFWSAERSVGEHGVLPQRVPRAEFFTEMLRLEEPDFRTELANRRTQLEEALKHRWRRELDQCGPDSSQALLTLGMLPRFGMNREAVEWSNDLAAKTPEAAARIASVRLSAHVSDRYDDGKPGDPAFLQRVADQVAGVQWKGQNLDEWVRLALLGQLVVARFRYARFFGPKSAALVGDQILKELRRLTEVLNPVAFKQGYLMSTVLRGLAFWNDGPQKGQMHPRLERSLSLATDLPTASEWESVLRADLMLTTRQSLAKQLIFEKSFAAAEQQLRIMGASDDPLDSTPHAELGFFLHKQSRVDEAVACFTKAAELGPPGVPMHRYFAGQCWVSLGDPDAALHEFQRSVDADDKALSPLVAMIELHFGKRRHEDARRLAKRITKDLELASQMDEHDAALVKKALT